MDSKRFFAYRNENSDLIAQNKVRKDKEAREVLLKIEEEQYRKETLRLQALQEERAMKLNKKKLWKETNELQLGERNTFSNFMIPPGTSGAVSSNRSEEHKPSTHQIAYKPFEAFFNQRPLPKMLSLTDADVMARRRNETELYRDENYRRAGGFNAKTLDQRNWVEMLSCFSEFNVETS